jgi:endonuclease YncB( thermonuclease family)
VLLLAVLAFPAALLTLRGRSAGARGASVEFVERVIDGDTLRLAGGETVRLVGIDAPELHEGRLGRTGPFPEPGAVEAAARLRVLAEGRRVRVERRGQDRYGRTLARVALPDGADVAARLLSEGLVSADR